MWLFPELGNVVRIRTGSINPSDYPNEKFELYSIPAYDSGDCEVLYGANIKSNKSSVKPEDVLFSKLNPRIPRVWIVKNKQGFRQISSTEFWALHCDKTLINRNFLRHLLLYPSFRKRFSESVEAATKSRSRIKPFQLLSQKIPLPPLSEQRLIVEILDQADDLRKKRAEADAKAEQILPALFIKKFGEPTEWLSTANTKPIGSLVNVRGGGTPSKNNPDYWKGSIPWVSPKDMKQDILFDAMDHISDLAIKETSVNYIAPGAVLIVVRGMILAHTIPIALAGTRLTINQDMKALMPNCDDIDSNYLYAALKASSSALLSQVGTAGHGTRKLDTDALLKTPILIPSRSKLDAFRKEMTLCRKVISGINKTKIQIEKLFELFLQHAFSGDLTAKWREAHMSELLAEMEQQTKILGTTAELHYEQLTLIESKEI